MKSYSINDQLLIDLLIRRDTQAFKLLYDTYSPSLHGSIIDIVANKELAAQILERAFFTAWETINSYDQSKQNLFTWMLHIARRISIETLRSINAWPSASQLEKIAGGLRTILKDMDSGQRRVIELMYYQGFSKSQVAETLHISLDTVNNLFNQGMAQLHLRLDAYTNQQ
jgi:RNA polymerase sigma-70 factor (ECF subfamily)